MPEIVPYTPSRRAQRRIDFSPFLDRFRDRVLSERERVQAINRADLLRRYREQQSRVNAVNMPFTAGATNVIQRAVIRQRSGKRVRQKSVNFLSKLSKANTSQAILRWQNMTPYDSNGGLQIGYQCTGGITNDRSYSYPVYIFDVTSCRMQAASTIVAAQPMYRLVSDDFSVFTNKGNFGWSVVSGETPDGLSTTEWRTERGRGADAVGTAPSFGPNAMLAWSDVRLALYGATNQTTRFTVQFIQFTDECYHPRVVRTEATPGATTNADVNDEQGRFNAAMEELVKPLVYHPLHVAGNATNVYRVLSKRTFDIQPDTSTNEDKASPNVCYKLFKRMNRICKWNWQTSDVRATTTSTESKILPNIDNGLDNVGTYNQFFGGTKKPYVHPNARIYMMITAQAYTRSGIQPNGTTTNPPTPADTPTFDVIVRNKWLYDAV